jgi:type VI secretion system secreted protein Hcp
MSKGDMFLTVAGQKTGPIKGESQDELHKDEIDVLGWSWGIQARAEMAGGGASGKATIKELRLLKNVDRASTALMSLATSNEVVKKAVLTVRKAGTTQQEFFKLTIENGRITAYDVQAPESEASPLMLEIVTFAFQKIAVDYRMQGEDGQLRGTGTYSHDIK